RVAPDHRRRDGGARGSHDAIRINRIFECGEKGALAVEVLVDRLDDDMTISELGEVVGDIDRCPRGSSPFRRHTPGLRSAIETAFDARPRVADLPGAAPHDDHDRKTDLHHELDERRAKGSYPDDADIVTAHRVPNYHVPNKSQGSKTEV